ncbi:MAG TPA: hypothetical protein ENG78_07725 [Acidiferrobacteraceae bacterium]|nr:hypothetical protein [Acidiferrobacteraceae bacterium]HEX20690.1 hypothetical protein [Acidiferrobacteraceae bacterium]
MRTIRIKTIDSTGDSVQLVSVDEANGLIQNRGRFLAYDGKTNEQIHKIGDNTEEVVLSRAIVAG